MNITHNNVVFEGEKVVLHRMKFALLIALQIPSIIISLLIFLFFLGHRTALKSLQNQALLLLLVINFLLVTVDLPMPIHFYRLGYVSPANAIYCTWWTFIEYFLNLTSELLMATISVQRHMLVFHRHLLRIRLKRRLLYYLPLLLCLIYPVLFYLIAIVFYPCDGTQWDYQSNLCGYANCYLLYDRTLAVFDWSINNGLPIIITLAANLMLLLRVIKKRLRFRQSIAQRKRERRMTLQLLRISSLYLIAWLPSLIIGLVQQVALPRFLAEFQTDYALDFIYMICLSLPWVGLQLLPECTKWLSEKLRRFCRVRNIVRPM